MTGRTMLEQEIYEQMIAQGVDETTADFAASDVATEQYMQEAWASDPDSTGSGSLDSGAHLLRTDQPHAWPGRFTYLEHDWHVHSFVFGGCVEPGLKPQEVES